LAVCAPAIYVQGACHRNEPLNLDVTLVSWAKVRAVDQPSVLFPGPAFNVLPLNFMANFFSLLSMFAFCSILSPQNIKKGERMGEKRGEGILHCGRHVKTYFYGTPKGNWTLHWISELANECVEPF